MRILIAEDEPELAAALEAMLKREHYSVDVVHDGDDTLDYGLAENYDGLVLDIMMPGLDGIQVLRQLRQRGITTPALFLTARTEISQRVEGLDAGADDYLPKPFATPELLARLRAMLRRGDTYTPDLLTFHGVSLNRSTYELIYGGETRRLGGREFQVLEMMMQHPRAVMTTERLMTHIWG